MADQPQPQPQPGDVNQITVINKDGTQSTATLITIGVLRPDNATPAV